MKSQQSTRWAWTLTLLLFCSHTCVATSGGWHDVIIIHQLHSLSPSFQMRRPKMVRCGEHWLIVCWDLLSTPPFRKAWTTHHDPSNRPDAAAPDPGASRQKPGHFFKDCRGIPRSTGFSTQKNIQKPAGLALANPSVQFVCKTRLILVRIR